MEFFKSKYYIPLCRRESVGDNPLDTDSLTTPHQRQVIRDINDIRTTENLHNIAHAVLRVYGSSLLGNVLYRFCREDIIRDWILVTDLTNPAPAFEVNTDPTDTDKMFNYVYFHKESETFVLVTPAAKELPTKYPAMSRGFIPHGVDPVKALAKLVETGYIAAREATDLKQIGLLTVIDNKFGITYTNVKDINIDIDTMYSGDFRSISDNIVKHIQPDTKSGLILLHGAPGTGKTSYIKWLATQTDRKIVFVPTSIVKELSSPRFIGYLIDSPGIIFVVEDAESVLCIPNSANRDLVSALLNLTDGFLSDSLDCQFICTFNTDLRDVDDALLRPGRLLISHEFKDLDVDEANNYLISIKSDRVVTKPSSLAQLINIDDIPKASMSLQTTSIGFLS